MEAEESKDVKGPVELKVPCVAWGWIDCYCPSCKKVTRQKICITQQGSCCDQPKGILCYRAPIMCMKQTTGKYKQCEECGKYFAVKTKKDGVPTHEEKK